MSSFHFISFHFIHFITINFGESVVVTSLPTINDYSGKIGQKIAEFGPKNVINRKLFVINKLSIVG